MLLLAALIVGQVLDLVPLLRTASLPIVVICLAGEGFARALTSEGPCIAAWRALITLATAVAIVLLSRATGILALTVRYPEIVLLEIAAVIALSVFLDFRVFESRDPAPEASSPPSGGIV